MKITSPLRAALITVLAVAGMAAVSGCAAQPVPRLAPAPAAPSGPVAAGMLTTTAASLRQGWYLYRAQQQLVSRCMDDQGLRYLVPDPGPEPARQATTSQVPGGHPATYGISLGGSASTGRPAEDQYVDGLPEAVAASYTDALSGPPAMSGKLVLPSGTTFGYETGGCVGDARRALFGTVRAALQDSLVPQDIQRTFITSLKKNAAYGAALRRWQQCMGAAGWHYASPQDSITAIRGLAARDGTSPALLTAQQGQVAGADVACDGRTRLRATMASALAAFARTLPRSELALLRQIYARHQQAVRTAIRDLAG